MGDVLFAQYEKQTGRSMPPPQQQAQHHQASSSSIPDLSA